MDNSNSSTNENRTDYSTDHTEDLSDYATEYEGDDSAIGESARYWWETSSGSGNSSFSSDSESSATENPVTENRAAEIEDDNGYITLGQAIPTLIGVDPTFPEQPHAARPANVDDIINYLKYVIWHYQVTIWLHHQVAVSRAAPYMHVQPANVGNWVIPAVASAGIMPPGTRNFPAVPPASGTVTFSGMPPAGMMPVPPPGTGALFGVPPAGMPAVTGNLSSVPPAAARGNGGHVPIPQPSTVVPPANDEIVLVPESSSAVPPGNDGAVPTEGNAEKAVQSEQDCKLLEDKKQKGILIEESKASSSKPSNIHLKVLSLYKDSCYVPDKPKPVGGSSSSAAAMSAFQAVAQAMAQPQVCLTLSLRDYLTNGNCSQLNQDEKARKAEGLRMFRQVVQTVHAAEAEGIVLTDMRPSKFIFASPGPHLRYTSSLVLAETRSLANHLITRKRQMDIDQQKGYGGLKSQKVGEDMEKELQKRNSEMEKAGYFSQFYVTYCSEDDPTRAPEDPEFVKREKKWYDCVGQRFGDDLRSYNVYSLGVLLFELLCHFESPEKHSATMEDLSKLILPEKLLAGEPEAAGLCLRILNPATRPSTGDILDILAEYTFEEDDAERSEEDVESTVLLEFLLSLQERKEKRMARIIEELKLIDTDLKQVKESHEAVGSSKGPIPRSSFNNLSQMEPAYFSMKSRTAAPPPPQRTDTEILGDHQVPNVGHQKELDEAAYFFQGVCKFAEYSKFKVCGSWWNSDLVPKGIYSMSFDPEEQLIATARASRSIKILEFGSLLDDSPELPYTSMEMNNDSELTCVCWNRCMKNYLASADYNGVVKIWDANTGKEMNQYKEHNKRAWQVDTSCINPTLFASASEEGSVKLWSMSQLDSTATIQCRYNLCSVQYSSHSLNMLAIGSATGEVYCYDLRNTIAPWCVLTGHKRPVTYVKFLDSETLVSSSTESNLKIWDLKKSNQDGPSLNSCTLTLTGHQNSRHFAGLAVYDGYIACGSETNEVFAYHRSFPMPITSHTFGAVEPISEQVRDEAPAGIFVSSVCWGQKSGMLVAANLSGSMKVLHLA